MPVALIIDRNIEITASLTSLEARISGPVGVITAPPQKFETLAHFMHKPVFCEI